MKVDGELLLPPRCQPSPIGPRATLCAPAFRRVAHGDGAAAAHLVDSRSDSRGETYVFAAVIDGSGECGAYAFWVIRVGGALRITPPVEGCFHVAEGHTPVVRWGPPLTLVTSPYALDDHTETFVLDERTYSLMPE